MNMDSDATHEFWFLSGYRYETKSLGSTLHINKQFTLAWTLHTTQGELTYWQNTWNDVW